MTIIGLKDNSFCKLFSYHPHWFPIFDAFKSGQSREPPFCKFMKGRELITANKRKTEVTSAVKNYQKGLRSQHLLKVDSRDHLETGKKVATLRCSEFPQEI